MTMLLAGTELAKTNRGHVHNVFPDSMRHIMRVMSFSVFFFFSCKTLRWKKGAKMYYENVFLSFLLIQTWCEAHKIHRTRTSHSTHAHTTGGATPRQRKVGGKFTRNWTSV